MPLPDLYDLTEIDDQGRARIRSGGHSLDKLMQITAGCPCDQCPLARWCKVECARFRG